MRVKFGMFACKAKHFLMFVLSTVITSFILCVFNRQQPVNLQSIVTKTTKQLEQLKENLQVTSFEKKFDVDDHILVQLGLRKQETGNASSSKRGHSNVPEVKMDVNQSFPVLIATGVTPSQLNEVPGFLASLQSLFLLHSPTVVLWDLETSHSGEEETDFSAALKDLCNSTRCWVEKFPFNDYPVHVKDYEFKAYRPLIIQTLLDRGGCVLWLDIDHRLLPRSKQFYAGLVNMALNGGSNGVVGWSLGRPTSSFTHPKTFPYFQTGVENYYFHRMIDPAQLLMCNTEFVNSKVMLPWVQCALTKDCISPFGAQSTGCRFDKKPLYRYSGCHAYDSSALNVVLGLAFPLHQPYIARAPITQAVNAGTHQNVTTKEV